MEGYLGLTYYRLSEPVVFYAHPSVARYPLAALRHLAGVAELRLRLGVPPDPGAWRVSLKPRHPVEEPDAVWFTPEGPVAVEYDAGATPGPGCGPRGRPSPGGSWARSGELPSRSGWLPEDPPPRGEGPRGPLDLAHHTHLHPRHHPEPATVGGENGQAAHLPAARQARSPRERPRGRVRGSRAPASRASSRVKGRTSKPMARSRLTMRSGSFPLALSLPATSARFTALMAAPSRSFPHRLKARLPLQVGEEGRGVKELSRPLRHPARPQDGAPSEAPRRGFPGGRRAPPRAPLPPAPRG